MAKWDIPNGGLGYEKRGSGHRNKGAEVEFWGVEGREMGFISLVTRPKLGETGEKEQSFYNYTGMENGIKFRYKTWKTTLKPSISPLYRILITNILHYTLSHPDNDFSHHGIRTMQWTKNLHLHLQLQKKSFCVT